MKVSKKFLGTIVCLVVILSWQGCKKEVANQHAYESPLNVNQKQSGVLPDDPAKIERVPTIMSHDFLALAASHVATSYQLTSVEAAGKRTKDVTPPTISISSPSNGTTVSGVVVVKVNATDNVGVTSVNFGMDGANIGSSSSSPFSISWNSATVANGTHTLKVTGYDGAGNKASDSVQLSINNVSPGDVTSPTVNIISPANNASVSGVVNVSINATDNVAVASVKFNVDGNLQGTATSSPYSFSWNTGSVAAGFHTLTAIASDAAGNSSSNSIQVTVNTTILPPGPLPASAQLMMPPVQNQGGESSCVPFATAYAARSAELYYKLNATSYDYSTNIFSPEFVYDQTKSGDCGSGSGLTTALDFMISTGVCTWQSMPYSSSNGCSLVPTSSQLAEAANYKISSYSKIITSDTTAMKSMIVNKHPVIITVAVDQSFLDAQPGFIWKIYSSSPGISHTLVICGYDDAKHAYKVMNSWGTTWGDAGFSWIDYDFLSQAAFYYSYVINN